MVCCIIIFIGGFPFPTIHNEDLLALLKSGYRMEKPDNCSPEVYVYSSLFCSNMVMLFIHNVIVLHQSNAPILCIVDTR